MDYSMIYPNSSLKLHFPEIDKSDDYIIHWKYLDYFKYLIGDLDNLTFGEISLARIKILEIENKITKERNDIYFNLINSFINNEYCESKKIWKNYPMLYLLLTVVLNESQFQKRVNWVSR